MGKGSWKKRNQKKKASTMKKSSPKKTKEAALHAAALKLSETKMDTSSDKPPAIVMPGTEEYETAWQKVLRDAVNKANININPNPPLDALGRPNPDYKPNTKENEVAARTGQLAPLPKENERKVILFRDHKLEFPELHLRVFITGPSMDRRGFPQLFARAYCEQAHTIQDADLVVFTGGPDIDPAYYGEKPVPSYCGDEDRDFYDLENFWQCYNEGIPVLGVCRGAQLLAVMQGGKLVQDVDNHNGDHSMWDKKQRELIEKVSSVHHQQVLECEGMDVIATSFNSTTRWLNPTRRLAKNEKNGWLPDIEAFFIRDFCGIGVQGHPEYKGYNAFAKWTLELINELVVLNPDVDWVAINGDGECRRRLKPEFLKERELRLKNKVATKEERKILHLTTGNSTLEGEK